MKLFTDKAGTPTVIFLTIVLLLSAISLPYIFSEYRYQAIGQAYMKLIKTGMGQETARQMALPEGPRVAAIMMLGQHIPITIFLITVIGLIAKSTSSDFKRRLRILYLVTFIFGVPILAYGFTFLQDNPYPVTLISALIIYTIIAAVLWTIIGIGIAIRGK